MKEPESITMTPEEIHNLRLSLQGKTELNIQQRDILIGLLDNHLWLQFQLQEAKISIYRLRKIFGVSSEKRPKASNDNQGDGVDSNSSVAVNNNTNACATIASENNPKQKKRVRKGSGRRSADEYTGAEIIHLKHEHLCKGAACTQPYCPGKVYLKNRPGKVVRVSGNTLFSATVYKRDVYECNICKTVYVASLPDGVSKTDKYDTKAKVIVATNRLQLGVAMYRQEMWQEQVGVPFPSGTQWKLTLEVYQAILPIFKALLTIAAQYDLFYIDDTWVRILEIIAHNKRAESKAEKKGTHTTGLIAIKGNSKIVLYFSGIQHAGQNLNDLLSMRDKSLPMPIQMNDALNCNGITEGTIQSNCTVHGRRKFVEIEHLFPLESRHVIDAIATVYKNDSHSKTNNLSLEERLAYHQQHSKPIMDKLRQYMQDKLDCKEVEPNSSLGKAFQYWLCRWNKMTQYLRVAGAPLDNNIIEQGLKRIILFRKNCLFHKTVHSAKVTSQIASVIATSISAGINPNNYLEALVDNKDRVVKEPERWLPWNYQQQLNTQHAA